MTQRSLIFFYFVLLVCVCSVAHAQSSPLFATGDLNGDGKPDVVALNPSTNNIAVYLNTGTGSLAAPVFIGVFPDTLTSINIADLNGDGFADILVLGTQQMQILLGNGHGGFSAPTKIPAGILLPLSNAVIADFNGDGFPDIAYGPVVPFETSPQIAIFFGDGHGNFSSPLVSFIGTNQLTLGVTRLFLIDANNDGKPDLAANVRSSPGVGGQFGFVAVNDGTGRFTSTMFDLPASLQGMTTTGDFNGDGNVDYVLGPSGFSSTFIFGDGTGRTLYSAFPFNVDGAGGFAADLNHDGLLDLVINSGYYPGNGHGGFGDLILFTPALPGDVVAIADMNGDGHPDLIVVPTSSNTPTVVLNTLPALPVSASSSARAFLSASVSNVGQPVSYIAHITSDGGFPVGTVAFTDGAASIGSAAVNVYGWAAVDTTFTTGGSHTNAVAFAGTLDAATGTTFGNSSDSTGATVNSSAPLLSAPTVSFTMSPNPARQLTPVTLTPAVTSASGTPGGFVVFRADGNVIGIAPVNSSTTAVFPNPGLHTIQASYGGDGTFPAATSGTVVEDIRAFNATRAASSVQLSVTPGANNSFVLGATLAGVSNPPANFIFRVDGAFLAALPPGQTARFQAPSQGTFKASVEYPGDAALLPSTASSTVIVGNPAGDFSLSSSPSSVTIKAGQSAVYTFSLSSSGGFSSTTTFSCSGLPAASTCSFSPASVAPTNGIATTTLTITTTAAAVTVPGQPLFPVPNVPPGVAVLVAGLMMVLLALRKPRKKLLGLAAMACLLLLMAGCGGGGGSTPPPPPPPPPNVTPQGTFAVTVTANSAAVSHTQGISLVVQ